MKKSILIGALWLCFGQLQAQTVQIKGSDTMLPLVQALIEIYMEVHNDKKVSVTGGGSGTGIVALMDGSVDVAMASRSLKTSEKLKLNNAGKKYIEKVIAFDALSIIVHPSNPVNQLTREQLEGIFTGKITNWKDVGGKDMPIVVFTRESSSGTYEFMKEHVMAKKEFANTAIGSPSNAGIVQSVSQTPGGIGYVGLAYIEDVITPVSVSFGGKEFIKPSFKNALDNVYPISRPLHLYYLQSSAKNVQEFIDFVMTPLGQEMVTHKGYIPKQWDGSK